MKRFAQPLFTLLIISSLISCAHQTMHSAPAQAQAMPLAQPELSKPIQFSKIIVKLKRGDSIGAAQTGPFCIGNEKLTWKGGRFTLNTEDFTDAFQEELEKASFRIIQDTNTIFADNNLKPEIMVAAVIKEINAQLCYDKLLASSTQTSKGQASVKVDWQIYSKLDKSIVLTLSTSGAGQVTQAIVGGDAVSISEAFASATRALITDQKFRSIVAKAGASVKDPVIKAGEIIKISQDSTKLISANPADWSNAVAVISNGNGHGSGFLISENLLLTNHHVVNELKTVQVKFVNGVELPGNVVSSDQNRDIALIQLEASFPKYFKINSTPLQAGADIFAIGSPLFEIYSASISKGVVSGIREREGKMLIQSDVNIRPGNSGGPLVDHHGNVVGVAVSGLVIKNIPQGINFFIPIADALKTLQIQVIEKNSDANNLDQKK